MLVVEDHAEVAELVGRALAKDGHDVVLARSIVDGYLLDRPCVVPAPREFGEDKARLLAWGVKIAGRRCKAVEPGAS